jgi:hypothetical protein
MQHSLLQASRELDGISFGTSLSSHAQCQPTGRHTPLTMAVKPKLMRPSAAGAPAKVLSGFRGGVLDAAAMPSSML